MSYTRFRQSTNEDFYFHPGLEFWMITLINLCGLEVFYRCTNVHLDNNGNRGLVC